MFWDSLKDWNLNNFLLLKDVLLEISSGGILSGGILERGDFVRGGGGGGGFVLRGYCPGDIVWGILSGGYCLWGILSGGILSLYHRNYIEIAVCLFNCILK